MTSPRHVRFTPNNGRWTAHKSAWLGVYEYTPVVRQFGAPQVQVSMLALAGKTAPLDSANLHAEVPASMRGLFETNVARTRALYQHSVNAFQAAFESWESSFDAAGQGAMALNHKVIDISERNISSGFDLATRLLASKTLVEALEVQTAYWGRQLGELRMQAEEVRALLEKVTSTAVEPIKAQVMRDIEELIGRIRSTQP